MIEQIEELKPELQIPSLCYVRVLISREISFRERRLPELLSFLVAIRAQCGCGELTSGKYAKLPRRGREYAGKVSAPRVRLVIASDIRIVQIVCIGIVVTTRTERLCGDHRERVSSLINCSAAKSPASAQKPDSPMATV